MEECCAYCGSVGSLLSSDQGLTCGVCGGVMAITRNETETDPTRRKNADKRTSLPKQSFTKVNKDRVTLAYITTLQNCLVAHVNALIQLGVDPLIESVTRKIWIRVLEVTRVMYPGAMHKALQKFSPLLNNACPSMESNTVELELESVEHLYNHYASYTSCLWRFVPLETIVWVLYSALVWLQEAIQPLDLTMWIDNGTLPFLKLISYQDQAQSLHGVNLPKHLFQPKATPRPLEIEVGAAQLAKDIGLELPPINTPLHIFRVCKILEFPHFVAQQAVGLYGLHWRCLDWDQEMSKLLYYPYMVVGACVLASLKMNYGLDDTNRLPSDGSSTVEWLQWAQDVWRKKIHPVRKHLSTAEEMEHMSSKDLIEMMEYVDKTVMAGSEYKRHYAGFNKRITKLVNKWKYLDSTKAAADDDDDVGTLHYKDEYSHQGVRFKVGENESYVPTLYLYPCKMYWFTPSRTHSLVGAVDFCPFDFAAALSVLCGILNIKPKNLESALIALERDMLMMEINAVNFNTNSKPTVCFEFAGKMEEKIMCYALNAMNLSPDMISNLLAKETDQIAMIGTIPEYPENVRKDQLTEEELINKAVLLYHDNYCLSPDHLAARVTLPRNPRTKAIERDCDLRTCRESPERVLHHAMLSKYLGEPFASLGVKLEYKYLSFYWSQTHHRDDVTAKEEISSISSTGCNSDDST